MSQPIFPSIEQILDVLMAEMPEGVYAEDRADDPNPDNRSYSSTEIRAHAQLLANLYSNLQGVNEDKTISTVTPTGIGMWETVLFQAAQDSSQPFDVRKANLLTKFQSTGGISYSYINALVHGILDPLGIAFDLVNWSGFNNGAWVLDVSELDVGTYLTNEDPLLGANQALTPLDCNLDYAAAGLTAQDLLNIQETAYTYEVRIYGNASAATLALLDQTLTRSEKAGSTHVITNNAPLPVDPNWIDMGIFTADTLVDAIDCGIFIVTVTPYDVFEFGGF